MVTYWFNGFKTLGMLKTYLIDKLKIAAQH